MVGLSLGRPPKKLTVPRRAAICRPSSWALPEAAATMMTSAPRPSVSLRTASTVSVASAPMASSGETRPAAISRRCWISSIRNTLAAPRARASRTCMQPIGPAPTTTTVSPSPTPACSWPLITQASGSATDASANDSPSGMRLTPSTASTLAGTRMSSAKPPSYW
jgi:hypothetical protein